MPNELKNYVIIQKLVCLTYVSIFFSLKGYNSVVQLLLKKKKSYYKNIIGDFIFPALFLLK